jgi:hypothetical protein
MASAEGKEYAVSVTSGRLYHDNVGLLLATGTVENYVLRSCQYFVHLSNCKGICLYRTVISLLMEPECSLQLCVICHGNDVASYLMTYAFTSSLER